MKHAWHDDGRLLLLLPDDLLIEWRGSGPDYDRACVAGRVWLGSVPVADGVGLVLGGDPGIATFARDVDGTLVLIRWIYADDGDELIEFSLRGEAVEATEPDFLFENRHPSWELFDAAADPAMDAPSTLRVELPVGPLRVTTALLQAEQNSAIVHRFYRVASPRRSSEPFWPSCPLCCSHPSSARVVAQL